MSGLGSTNAARRAANTNRPLVMKFFKQLLSTDSLKIMGIAIVGVVLFFVILNKAVPSVRDQVGDLTGL